MENEIEIFYSKDWSFDPTQGKLDYELLDTGEGEKLERFGPYIFVRPYEDAVWPKALTKEMKELWNRADGKFWSSKQGAKSGWKFNHKIEKKWIMEYKPARHASQGDASGGIKFLASPTPFRHLGFFPEQASHWDFIEEKIRARVSFNFELPEGPNSVIGGRAQGRKIGGNSGPGVRFLNLFGYTGMASLFALRAGAEVTHIDASKSSIEWAKENQKISGLEKMPMRIICDDVLKFIEREGKRGNKYDAVIMDPPKFGRGPKGEVWNIEKDLPRLLNAVRKILSDKPLFVILTSYAVDSFSLPLGYALSEMMKSFSGTVKAGELCILEKSQNRLIPLANTAIWSAV